MQSKHKKIEKISSLILKKNHEFVNAEKKSRLFQVIFLKSKIFLKYSRAFKAGV